MRFGSRGPIEFLLDTSSKFIYREGLERRRAGTSNPARPSPSRHHYGILGANCRYLSGNEDEREETVLLAG